jgi:hypothetical protein
LETGDANDRSAAIDQVSPGSFGFAGRRLGDPTDVNSGSGSALFHVGTILVPHASPTTVHPSGQDFARVASPSTTTAGASTPPSAGSFILSLLKMPPRRTPTPVIKIQEVSCAPNTPNTLVRCIGALVRRRDGEIQVIWMIISGICNLK